MKIQSRQIPALLFLLFTIGAAGLFCVRNRNVILSPNPVLILGPGPGSEAESDEFQTHSEPAFPININEAGPEELDHLPGIGPSIAQAIVEYRTVNGPFQEIEDLLEVSGIGPAKLEEIRPYITLGG